MILPPLAGDCNERFPAITHPFFDDHHARTAHDLQQRLKQLAPATLDGGRAILWFCRWCQKPWYQLGRAASFVCLSKIQVVEIAQQLGAEVRLVSSFPIINVSSLRCPPSWWHAQDRGVPWQARLPFHMGGDNVTKNTFILYTV